MVSNQKSKTSGLVQKFYSLIYEEFNNISEDLKEDNFISNFDKYFKNFAENGYFAVEEKKDGKIVKSPYLEFHIEKEENFVFINTKFKKVKNKKNSAPFKDEGKKKNEMSLLEKLAKEMGYVFKEYPSKNEKKNKTSYKLGFRIPYSDFERQIKKYAFEQLNRRINTLKKRNEELKEANEVSEKKISSIKNENKNIKKDKIDYKKAINDLKGEIKEFKDQNERLIEENHNLKSSEYYYKIKIEESNKKQTEKNNKINGLVYLNRMISSEFEKIKKNYGVVIYNIWRMGRTIKKDYNVNKQNFESINNMIDLFGKNLEDSGSGFEDKEADLEFLENQKLLINESLKSLERTSKQYDRILILLEKSGIKIEEYDDIKIEDKLNVTILDVIESSQVQEIVVETVKPSIYYVEKRILKGKETYVENRIFEGEIILTKPKK